MAAIDHALRRARHYRLTDTTIHLDWVYYRELVKLKGIEATREDQAAWEGQTGLTPECTLPIETVRRVPVHVNKPPEYSSTVRGMDRGVIVGCVVKA